VSVAVCVPCGVCGRSLDMNDLGEGGAKVLAPALQQMTQMQTLT
jgi:hypothetical protein